MCDIDCANLIDLSLEETPPPPQKTENVLLPSSSENLSQQGLLHFVSPPRKNRQSLENNPFDCVQKMANCQDDPFDIVEREACFKARLCAKPLVEVKLGNLLSLSDENLAANDFLTEEGVDDACRSKLKNFDLESESPPVTMIDKFQTDSMDSNSGTDTDSNPGNSAELSATSKLKKSMEYRKRLLKLSVTNAAFSSPVARRGSLDEGGNMGTPVASALTKSPYLCEFSLAAESPLKFVDDDIMSEEPPPLLNAEQIFEADLEMLKIPMLSELQSPVTQNESPITGDKSSICDNENDTPVGKTKILDLEAIKLKLRARREGANNNNNHHNDINSLICDLKSLINGGDMAASGKQMQASSLLESLSSALSTSQNGESSIQSQNCPQAQPQPIKRQGTFDLELQETPNQDLASQPLVTEMPSCMVSSSATYDGETAEDKQELNLPEIDPPSPESHHGETTLQHDVNDIVEQLSKLLIHNNSADGNQTVQQNPTFIVVMNTTPMLQNNSTVSSVASAAKQKAAMISSSYMENSSLDDSPELNMANATTRRRSQSLSLHDKVKIVQLPLQPPTPKTLQKQHGMTMDDSSPVTTTPPPKEVQTTDYKTPEFKTPARMVRRNSYSSGTPYTATVGMRRTGFGSDPKTPSHGRMTQTLDTHHEGQQQQQKAIVRPMSIPANNLPAFKPDLKKKHKVNAESIMKSSGPLKATIPVKKVAPMVKTSPPTPDNGHSDDLHNSSQHKFNKIPTTPMAAGRSSTLGVAAGYPNACSTPSITSPTKRSVGGSLPKPRYSYLSATPNPKPVSATSAALKRRTISEFKAKSPLKSRLSSAGSSAASTSARSNTTSSSRMSTSARLSTSSSARLPPSKANTSTTKLGANTATVRPTGRVGSSRLSSVSSTAASRNKENKHP